MQQRWRVTEDYMPVINGTIILESHDEGGTEFPIILRDDCPPNTIYFLPKGSRTANLQTGEVVKLAPGYYVNPRQCGAIKNVKV